MNANANALTEYLNKYSIFHQCDACNSGCTWRNWFPCWWQAVYASGPGLFVNVSLWQHFESGVWELLHLMFFPAPAATSLLIIIGFTVDSWGAHEFANNTNLIIINHWEKHTKEQAYPEERPLCSYTHLGSFIQCFFNTFKRKELEWLKLD